MINGSAIFTYINKVVGVNKDGEKYLSLNVLSDDNRKFSFITKNEDLINKLSNYELTRFQEFKLHFKVDRVFNTEKRLSYWSVELVGVG